MNEATLRYWIGFNRARGIGPARLRALIQYFGSVEAAWKAPAEQWKAAGLDQRSLASLKTARDNCDLDAALKEVYKAGAHLLTLDDPDYPPLLRKIYDPPPLLYGKGTLTEADQYALAIDAGGRTIAVMANGIDQVYPPEHKDLAETIAAHGALITELPIGTPPDRNLFVSRNRIVSGLSVGTVVVEAAEKSRALLTANMALDQGREVFAAPGNALSPFSMGTDALIQADAKMVIGANDILDELRLDRVAVETRQQTRQIVADNETKAILLRHLSGEALNIEELSIQTGLPIRQVNSTLTILELKGVVQQVGTTQYTLVQD